MFRNFWENLKRDRFLMLLFIIFIVEGPLAQLLNNGFSGFLDWFVDTLLIVPGILIGLSFHEYAHAKVAVLCGDKTPLYQGRVSLDPRAHIDPAGMVSLLFLHFGWGKPVQINSRNFYNRRRDGIFVGLAGVLMNFFVAIFTGLLIKLLVSFALPFVRSSIGLALSSVLMNIVYLNIYLMMFNLLPVPPLDGYGVIGDLFNLHNNRIYQMIYYYSRYIIMLILILRLPSTLLSTPCFYLVDFIMSKLWNIGGWYYLMM